MGLALSWTEPPNKLPAYGSSVKTRLRQTGKRMELSPGQVWPVLKAVVGAET